MSWGAVIVGGSAIVGGYLASQSSKSAANTQADAARNAASAQVYAADLSAQITREGMAQTKELTAPWREVGAEALSKLERMVQAGPGEYTKSPGYLFRLGEGEKAINRMASARGGLLSGGTGKALTRYAQDYATQDYDNFLNRYYKSLEPLQNLSQMGQASASDQALQTQAGYTNLANIQTQSGQAQAAGIVGAGQAQASNYLTQGKIWSNTLNQGLQSYALWKMGAFNGGTTNQGLSQQDMALLDYYGG